MVPDIHIIRYIEPTIQVVVNNSEPVVEVQEVQDLQIVMSSTGGVELAKFIFNEIPTGVLNGANASFTSAYNFVPETVQVYLNGVKLKKVDEFNTSGTTNITLAVSPISSEIILINYIKT